MRGTKVKVYDEGKERSEVLKIGKYMKYIIECKQCLCAVFGI